MTKRKLLMYFLIPILSVYLFICNLSIISYADVPSTQIVQSVSGNWTYNHSYGGLGKYFTLQDTTGLETCSSLAPYFYYTRDNVTFKKLSGVNTIAYVLNKVVGVVVSPEQLQTFYNKFFTAINVVDSNNHLQNGLYDNNDNFYGYALNDISGCYFNGNGSGTVNIPSYVSNNVKIVVDNEIDLTPPYFIYQPIPSINVINNYSTYSPISTTERENYIALCQAHDYLCNAFYLKNYSFYSFDQSSASRKYLYYNDNIYAFIPFYYTDANVYKNFCKSNNLTVSSNVVSFSNIVSFLELRPIDSSLNRVTTLTRYNLTDGSTSTVDMVSQLFNIGNLSANILVTTLNHDYYVYKNTNVIPSLQDKTYRPSAYTTTNFLNYNPNNDNSSQTTVSNIDNSITNNESIYNNVDNSYSEYIDNSVIDNSSVVNNTTNIVNNYYGSSSGDSGDSGGGSDNDSVLDTLLQGLLSFFNAIGRVLATVITGILDMFTTVLDAIASLTTDLTGITDFFGSLFGWLPEPVPQVLGIGISVCILCAVIRFIRG